MTAYEPQGGWFGPDERPLAGWWSLPATSTRHGVVIAGPIGYEWWSTHRTLRTLAECLADRGHTVLRFDYDGLGDSAGERWDPDRVESWRASLAHAVAAMRARGIDHVSLVGFRFGSLLTLLDGATLGVDAIAAWIPVESGRPFAKALRLLGLTVPGVEGASVNAGLVLSADTAAALGALDLATLPAPPAPRILLMARPEQALDALARRLRDLGAAVDLTSLPGVEAALDVPTEDATVPLPIVDAIAAWIGDAPPAERPALPALRETVEIRGHEGTIRETMTHVASLAAVRGDPTGERPSTIVVFLNSGSEAHVGPGRAWVDYARALTRRGHATLRVDFRGWGESPDDGHAPGRPYDRHCLDDTMRLTEALHADYDRVVLAGLCAGAWTAMRTGQATTVDGIVAINPQLYWDFGCPVEATIPQTRLRRTREREREALGGRYGLWSALDLVGIRPMASRWLATLRRRRTPVLMLFAENDDGLEYLRNRCSRALARELKGGYLAVEELDDLDHQMYREWRRGEVASRIAAFVERLG